MAITDFDRIIDIIYAIVLIDIKLTIILFIIINYFS